MGLLMDECVIERTFDVPSTAISFEVEALSGTVPESFLECTFIDDLEFSDSERSWAPFDGVVFGLQEISEFGGFPLISFPLTGVP